MSALLNLLKGFLVDVIVSAGVKIWQMMRKGPQHHVGNSDGTTEAKFRKKKKERWGDE